MRDENLYFSDLEKNEALNRLVQQFAEARAKTGFATNGKSFDEDINVYMAHLLFAFALPNYTYIVEQYISFNPDDVKMLVDMAEDEYFKYFIYKVNADNLLLHIGMFNDIRAITAVRIKQGMQPNVDYRALALEYYEQAAACNRKIHKRKTALSDVLVKIAADFDRYAKVLGEMKKEYFHFYDVFEDEEFDHFIGDLKKYERDREFEEKQDRFLSLYSQWIETHDESLRRQINDICSELHVLNEGFTFKIDN